MKHVSATSIALALVTSACSAGRYPDREVQICLRDDRGVAALNSILTELARQHKLEFFDQSPDREDERAEGLLDRKTFGSYPIHDYHLHDKAAGIEISASNLALGKYQATLSWDLRNKRQREVANELTTALERQFVLLPLPKGSGALPLRDCSDAPSSPPS